MAGEAVGTLVQLVAYVSADVKLKVAEAAKRMPVRTSPSSYVEGVLRKHFERKAKGGKGATR